MIYNNILELIGNTPLVRLKKIEEKFNLDCQVYAKLEKNNPAGSIKDRAVYQMLKDYLAKGLIQEGATIIEPTSGNTGIALACLCNYFNYQCIIVMPQSMSLERRKLIKAYGATLVLVDGGMKECVEKATEINNSTPNSVILGQFENSSNPLAHYLTTAKELDDDLKDIAAIFAGIGTGGTICGIGRYFKEKNKPTKIIGVEPFESPLITKGEASHHLIQGIGANFIPENYTKENVDEVVTVKGEDAIETAKMITKEEGLLVGITSGCNLKAAIDYAKNNNLHNQNLVVIFPDTGERYEWN